MARPGPLDYHRAPGLWAVFVATALFLYVPLLVMVLFSFNDARQIVRFSGFTLDWYARALAQDDLRNALVTSLGIALVATLAAVVIGTLTAIALWRFRFPLKGAFEGVLTLPIVVPEICIGVATYVFYSRIGLYAVDQEWKSLASLAGITCAHIAFCFPFVAVVVRARLGSFDRSLEEASRDLGASEAQTLWRVLLPHLTPAIVAGALLAFTLSLDDFVITYFTTGVGTDTFPVTVAGRIRRGVAPDINAASTILIVITATVAALGLALQGREARGKS